MVLFLIYPKQMGRMECLSLPASLQKCKRISAWLSSLLLGIYHISAPGRLCLLKYRLSSQILIYPKQAKLGSCLSPPLSLQNSKQSVRWLSSLSLVIYQLRGIPLLKSLNRQLPLCSNIATQSSPQISKRLNRGQYVCVLASECSNESLCSAFGHISTLRICMTHTSQTSFHL